MSQIMMTLRLVWIMRQLLRDRYPNASKIAEKFEVSDKTGRRDIDAVRDRFEVDIEFDHPRNGYFLKDKSKIIPGLWLRQDEWLALLIAEKIIENQNSQVADSIRTLIDEYCFDLPGQMGRDQFDKIISCHISMYEKVDDDVFTGCLYAAANREVIRFVYDKVFEDETSIRIVSPQHLYHENGNWTLLGWCHEKKGLKSFRPGRMLNLETNRAHRFHSVDQEKIREEIGSSFGAFKGKEKDTAVLLFSKNLQKWVSKQEWHSREKKILCDDGRIELHLPISNETEIKKIALSFGSDVEVLGPGSLVEKMKGEIKKMGGIY